MGVKKFSSEFIEQVRQANDIVSVISEYVPLKRQGRNFIMKKQRPSASQPIRDSFIALAVMHREMSLNL